jgi:CxxC motif-containing protein (DUF1111 family)
MKGVKLTWYLAAALLVFTPVGLRVLTWPTPPAPEIDGDMAQAGEVLFNHEWQPNDPLASGGDGLGPVYNAKSCVACHHQGGVGGSGGADRNVLTFAVRPTAAGQQPRQGVIHNFAVSPEYQEAPKLVDDSLTALTPPALRQIESRRTRGRSVLTSAASTGISLTQRNTPALFGVGLIDALPDRVLIAQERRERLQHGMASGEGESLPVGRAPRLADGRVGKFGWKGEVPTLADFVQAACANELGLGNPGQAQPVPLGQPSYRPAGLDLTLEQCNQMTAFCAALRRPEERPAATAALQAKAAAGKALFTKVGCADCHAPNLGSIEGIYSDLLLHRMGSELAGDGPTYYSPPPLPVAKSSATPGPLPDEWRTPPLWGVADSAPYLHDGRAKTLEEAITMHGGQGARVAQRFAKLRAEEQVELVEFLRTLRAP